MTAQSILSELKAFAAGRGFAFSDHSEQEIEKLKIKLEELDKLSFPERVKVFAIVFDEVKKLALSTAKDENGLIILREDDVRDATKAIARRVLQGDFTDLSPRIIGGIKACCPYC